MTKNRRYLYLPDILLITLLFILPLSGCQLAKETGTAAADRDQLCGVFVTFGRPERPVNEASLSDINVKVNKKGELVIDDQDLKSAFENKVEGTPYDNGSTIRFDGLEGYYMGSLHQDINGEDSIVNMADKGFHDMKYAVNKTDEGESRSCEGTLSVSTKFHKIVDVNPVYIRDDGTYYTIMGQSTGVSFSGSTSGSVYSQTLDNSFSSTVNGKTITDKDSYKVNVTVTDETKQVFIKEMNQYDELIKTTEYLRDDPEEFIVDSNTAYIIVEETLENSMTDPYVKRSVYSLDKDGMANDKVTHTCGYADADYVIGLKIISFTYE